MHQEWKMRTSVIYEVHEKRDPLISGRGCYTSGIFTAQVCVRCVTNEVTATLIKESSRAISKDCEHSLLYEVGVSLLVLRNNLRNTRDIAANNLEIKRSCQVCIFKEHQKGDPLISGPWGSFGCRG